MRNILKRAPPKKRKACNQAQTQGSPARRVDKVSLPMPFKNLHNMVENYNISRRLSNNRKESGEHYLDWI